jgi:hypothetical protein
MTMLAAAIPSDFHQREENTVMKDLLASIIDAHGAWIGGMDANRNRVTFI